jgi:CheY-like chemotaxis protein
MRVLVIDDNEDTAFLFCSLVKVCGCESRFCTISSVAIDIAREWQPNVILLDLAMPGIEGYQLGPMLRAACNETLTLLVLVSGYKPDPEKLIKAMIDDHLLEPVSLEQLTELLRQA